MELLIERTGFVTDADLDLATRHRYGDPEAFDEVYRRFSTMVYTLALRLTGDPADATDLCQDVFLKIFRHLGSYRGRSSLQTWVYRIAINTSRSRFRRQRWWQQQRSDAERVLEGVPDPGKSPEESVIARRLVRQVSEALVRVPIVYREALILRDIQGFRYAEIAEILGVRIGTVRSRIARGRDELHRQLGRLDS